MQCIRRPIPSKTALRVLRQLASETPCSTSKRTSTSQACVLRRAAANGRGNPGCSQRVVRLACRRAQHVAALRSTVQELSHEMKHSSDPDYRKDEGDTASIYGTRSARIIGPQTGAGSSVSGQRIRDAVTESLDAAHGDEVLDTLPASLEHWSAFLARGGTHDETIVHELRTLVRLASSSARPMDVLRDDGGPMSMRALFQHAVQLGAPALVELTVKEMLTVGDKLSQAAFVVDNLAGSPHRALYTNTISFLQSWIAQIMSGTAESVLPSPSTHILQLRISVLYVCSTLQGDLRFYRTLHTHFFQNVVRRGPHHAFRGLSAVLQDLLRSKMTVEACEMFRCWFPGSAKALQSEAADSLSTWFLEEMLLVHQDHLLAHKIVRWMMRWKRPVQGHLRKLWTACQRDEELLQMFHEFDLEGGPSHQTRNKLLYALAKHVPREVLHVELFGPRARMWASVAAQAWEEDGNGETIAAQLNTLQTAVGDRLLSPTMYETALRKCRQTGELAALTAVGDLRKALLERNDNSDHLVAIFQSARKNDWEAARSSIAALEPGDFRTMQSQTRVQIFDPVLGLFALKHGDAKEVFDFGALVLKHVCEPCSSIKTVLMLIESFIRTNNIDTAIEVHQYANTQLDLSLEATSVDNKNSLASYYYAFRPSAVVLASIVLRIYRDNWAAVSRLCLPLLLISASYETKMDHQTRITATVHTWTSETLKYLDEQEFRSEVAEGVQGPGSSIQLDRTAAASAQAAKSYVQSQRRMTRDDSGDMLRYEGLRMSAPPADIETEKQDQGKSLRQKSAAGHAAQDAETQKVRYHSTPPKATGVQAAPKRSWRQLEDGWHASENMDPVIHHLASDLTDENRSFYQSKYKGADAPSVNSRDAHFSFLRTKAELHSLTSRGSYAQAARVFEDAPLTNPVAQSAGMISIITRGLDTSSPMLAKALYRLAEQSGADLSLAKIPHLVAALSSTPLDLDAAELPELVEKLKQIITDDCARVKANDHIANHSLATGLANIMLQMQKPGAAVELLRHAFRSPLAALQAPGLSPLLALLRGYIRLGRDDGIMWVGDMVLARNERIEKRFLTALKHGRNQVRDRALYLPEPKRTVVLTAIRQVLLSCQAMQQKQIRHAWQAGKRLAEYIARFGKDAPTLDLIRTTPAVGKRKPATKGVSTTELWTDAAIVATLCRDIVALSQRTHARSRAHVEVSDEHSLRMPGLLAAARLRQDNARTTTTAAAAAASRDSTTMGEVNAQLPHESVDPKVDGITATLAEGWMNVFGDDWADVEHLGENVSEVHRE